MCAFLCYALTVLAKNSATPLACRLLLCSRWPIGRAHHIPPSTAKAALYNVLKSPALQRAEGVVDMVASLKTVNAVTVPHKWVRYL